MGEESIGVESIGEESIGEEPVIGSDKYSQSGEQVLHMDDNDDVLFMSPGGRRYYTPTCDDQFKPYINQFFLTLDAAYEFYKDYGRKCGFDVRKSSSKHDKDGILMSKYYVCSNAGTSEVPGSKHSKDVEEVVDESATKRRRTGSSRCDCDAKMVVKVLHVSGFAVSCFVEQHNHTLASEDSKQFLRCNRKLTFTHKNFILDLRNVNIGPMRAYGAYKEMVGSYENVGATASDFRNFGRDIKARIGEHDADMILEKFKMKHDTTDKSFFYDYKVDSDGHLTGLFWCDAVARRNYSVFGDIVSFDPTFRTNKYHMVFIPFTGVDNHWCNVTFAAALLEKEDYENFMWVLAAFTKAMDHIPPCVITDQCPAIKKALRKIWPCVQHRLCMWHIMNKLPAKVSPALASDKKFMQSLKSVVWADHLSVHEFEEGWRSVIAEYKLEDNAWLNDMYNIRDEWIPAYFNHIEMAGLLRTTSRSENSNFYFQHFHQSGDTLVDFYIRYECAIDKQRHQYKQNNKKSNIMPKIYHIGDIEKVAAEQYTRNVFYLVREEIESALHHTSIESIEVVDEVKHLKITDFLLKDTIFEVSVDLINYDVHCSCNLYIRRGYLCKHGFAGLHHCRVKTIPRNFIKHRWTKNAEKKCSLLISHEIPDHCAKIARMKVKLNAIWFDFQSCMSYVGLDEEKAEKMHTHVKLMDSEIRANTNSTCTHLNVDIIDAYIGSKPSNHVSVQNPNISRNKGCGSRIKSAKEVSIDGSTTKKRKCSRCGEVAGHNARSCPSNKS